MDELRREVSTLREFVVQQSKDMAKLKRLGKGLDVSPGPPDTSRLLSIEAELVEQKKSTARITKLCLAAINALERLENKPLVLGSDMASSEESFINSNESLPKASGLDPSVLKSLCGEIEKLTGMLVKVDEDIDALDERTEENKSDYEHLVQEFSLLQDSNRNSVDENQRKMEELKSKLSGENLRREIDTRIMVKDLVTKTDLSRGLKTIPFGLSRDDVTQMIDFATSNFLRTVQAETKMCEEKIQDSEEILNKHISNIQNRLDEVEDQARRQMFNIQEKTESNLREVSKTLGNLAGGRELQSRVQNLEKKVSNLEDVEPKILKLEMEQSNLLQTVTNLQDESRVAEDPRMTGRLERLGREISVLKGKQTDHSTSIEYLGNKQTSTEAEIGKMKKDLDQEKEKIGKILKLEQSLDQAKDKVEESAKRFNNLKEELNSKMDRTELDDLKTGMEKERCKINYFQDKISNIAKSVDGVKMENNNMRDRFCSDIENQGKDLKELKSILGNQEKQVQENSRTLKDITKDSIGKIKEVATNCIQIEKNIRSIKDKSVLFDNSLKEVRDQIQQIKYTQDLEQNSFKEQLQNFKTEKMNSSSLTGDDLNRVKETIICLEKDLKNLKQDRRTKDDEDEERRLSVEGNLLDLRHYVENILAETNSHLGGIAAEVDTAQDKISKCMIELEEIVGKHENHTGDYTFVVKSLENKMKELREYTESKQLDAVERLLELRKEFVDKHSDFLDMSSENKKLVEGLGTKVQDLKLGNLERINQELNDLRNRTLEQMKCLEKNVEDTSRANQTKFADFQAKLSDVLAENEMGKNSSWQALKDVKTNLGKLNSDLETLKVQEKVRKETIDRLNEKMNREEKDGSAGLKEMKEKQVKIRSELDIVGKQAEQVRKELECRMENNRRHIIEMIGSTEIKLSELEDRIKVSELALQDIKVTESNHTLNLEKKIENLVYKVDNYTSDTDKIRGNLTDETKETLVELRRSIDNMKTEMSTYELDSFKNIVNSTTETQNKLISSMQKNVDTILKEKNKIELLVGNLESKLSNLSCNHEKAETKFSSALQEEHLVNERVEERVQNIQLNIREIHEKLNQRKEDDVSGSKALVEEIRSDLRQKIQENSEKLKEIEELLGTEVLKLKTEMTSSGQILQDKFNQEMSSSGQILQDKFNQDFTEISKNSQERSALAETRLNEVLENVETQSKLLGSVQSSLSSMNENISKSLNKTDDLEMKLKSWTENAESNLSMYATLSALQELEKGLEKRTSNGSVKDLERKLETLSAACKSLDLSLIDLKSKDEGLESELKNMKVQVENLPEISSSLDQLKSVESKFNQQKAKIIDVEASLSFQERSINKLGEDVKKINGSVFGNISSVEDRLGKFESTAADLVSKISTIQKKTEGWIKEFEVINSGRTRIENKLSQIDSKVGQPDLEKLQSLVTEEVNRLRKDQKEIQNNIELLINTSRTEIETIKNKSRDERVEKTNTDQQSQLTALSTSISQLEGSLKVLETKVSTNQMDTADQSGRINSSIENMKIQLETLNTDLTNLNNLINKQTNKHSGDEDTKERPENPETLALQTTVSNLEKGLRRLDEELKKKMNTHQENQLSLIEKQRRSWEITREKAEQMSQIFDSLIITNDRPYVSCGVDADMEGPGPVIFNQFELINKIEWENEYGFCLMEPGVYLLQISGSLTSCTATVKLVSDQLEGELVSLSSGQPGTFRSRSTIFTVEDDDRDAEKIVVDICDKDGSAWVGSDFSLLMYKISEVSNSESGDSWKLVDI